MGIRFSFFGGGASSSSSHAALPVIRKGELKIPDDEDLQQKSLGGALELRKWNGRFVAIKMLSVPELDRFQKEVAALSQVTNHPNIVDTLGVYNDGLNSYVVVEYVEGGNLESFLKKHKEPLTWDQIFAFGLDICKAMQHVHKFNVVHRNLKPSNVMVVSSDPKAPIRVRVTDFGLARIVEPRISGKKTPVEYAAPETLKEVLGKFGPSVDVYSFGVLFNQLIARTTEPYPGVHTNDIPQEVLGGRRPIIPDYTPPILKQLIEAMWHADPQQRPLFPHVEAKLNAALEEHKSHSFPALPPP